MPARANNSLLLDPTRTVMLRKRFSAEIRRRFANLKRELIKLIVEEDAFGIIYRQQLTAMEYVNPSVVNSRWAYLTTPEQLEHFRVWLEHEINLSILSAPVSKYIQEAYLKGQGRAFTDVVKPALWTGTSQQTSSMNSYRGTEAQFLNSPVSMENLWLLVARANSELKGATEAMSQQLSRELLDGMVRGLKPRDIATNVLDRVTKVGESRSLTMVQTEVVRAHSEAVLDAMEALGVDEVGVMVEWQTGSNPCNVCGKLAKVVMPIAKARGMFPRHARCKCTPIPASPKRDNKAYGKLSQEQLRSKREVKAAINRSIRAEYPKRSLAKAKARSRWAQSSTD